MMKNTLIFLSLILSLLGCKKTDTVTPEDPKVAPLKLRPFTNQWNSDKNGAGGFSNYNSYKNFQYNFEVGSNNQPVEITLSSSDIDVKFVVYNPLGQIINTSSTGRNLKEPYNLNAGIYRLVICADRRALGKFTFSIIGVLADPVLVPSQVLTSGTQNWGSLGGGGFYKTFKNHFYTFEITAENTNVDIELQSGDTNVALVLYNELGQIVDTQRKDRYIFSIIAVKKGTYTAMACTDERGSTGNYTMNIFGKVNSLQRIISQTNSTKGSLSGSSKLDQFNYPYDTYSLQLTPNSSTLDIEMTSSDMFVELYLETNSGVKISNNVQTFLQNKSYYLVYENLPAGVYTVTTRSHNRSYGTYTLNVFGQFTDFKKI